MLVNHCTAGDFLSVSFDRAGKEAIPRKGIYRILVCRPNHRLGNTILLTPLIEELESLYRGAEIDIVAEGGIAADVFSAFPRVNHIYCLPKRGFKHPWSFLSMLLQVRRTRYDLIIDPCGGSNFSRVLTRFFKGQYKLGFGDPVTHPGLTHLVSNSVAMRHMAKRPVNLLRWGMPPQAQDAEHFFPLDIRLTDSERALGRSLLHDLLATYPKAETGPVIGIFANATGAKRYPAAWWNDFIRALKEACPDSRIIEIIPMHGKSMLGSEWPGYYSSNIRRMGAVMAGVDLMISADCGVMHLAVASKVPTVGMFCVTDASVYEPYGPGNNPLLTQGLTAAEAAGRVVQVYRNVLVGSADAQPGLAVAMPSDDAKDNVGQTDGGPVSCSSQVTKSH